MKTLDFPQGSPEWLQARAGKVTASRISDVMATIKTGEAAARRDYRAQILAELLTRKPQEDGFINDAMRWGTENEPLARAEYEIKTGLLVDQVGFVLHPSIDRAGASPDGLVGDDGLVEIKCPKTATHLQYLQDGRIPSAYEYQMLWQMACTERQWCDFASFDPRLPEGLQLFVIRFPRDDERIQKIEIEVMRFFAEVDAALASLAKRAA